MAADSDPMKQIPPEHQNIVQSTWSQLLGSEGNAQNLAMDLFKRYLIIMNIERYLNDCLVMAVWLPHNLGRGSPWAIKPEVLGETALTKALYKV